MTEKASESGLRATAILVGDTPYCVWEFDLKQRVRTFLNELDPTYFAQVANMVGRKVEGEARQTRALLLRLTYFHGLESLFALIGAMLQAPYAVPAWLLKYKTGDLLTLVQRIQDGKPFQVFAKLDNVSWEEISHVLHGSYSGSGLPTSVVEKGFARLWRRFARDLLQAELRDEYNSIKHGFRVRPGGFGMSLAEEGSDVYHVIGSSEFGTEFFRQVDLDAKGTNFRLRKHSTNWSPEDMWWALKLVSLSMANIVSYLQFINGSTQETKLRVPTEESVFDSPWAKTPGILAQHFDTHITSEMITPKTKKDILNLYRQAASA